MPFEQRHETASCDQHRRCPGVPYPAGGRRERLREPEEIVPKSPTSLRTRSDGAGQGRAATAQQSPCRISGSLVRAGATNSYTKSIDRL